MLPVIKVWGLDGKQSEDDLRILHQKIVAAVVGVSELECKDENDMTVLFPTDLMKYGQGQEIIVEISGLFGKNAQKQWVQNRLARDVGITIASLYSEACVDVMVQLPLTSQLGFWSNINYSWPP